MPPPEFFTKLLAGFVSSGIQGAVSNHLEENGTPCGIKGCELFSVAIKCGECGRPLCVSHLYFKPDIRNMRPKPICPSCIFDNHEELFK